MIKTRRAKRTFSPEFKLEAIGQVVKFQRDVRDVALALECPFGHSELPRNMHDTEKAGVALRLAWLERGHPRASAVADVLSAAGFPDFGKQLNLLSIQTAETISLEQP